MILEYITSKGQKLLLTGNNKFKLSNVDGLTVSNIDLSSSTVAGMDGDFVNNMRAIPRDIIIDLSIENDVENTKRYILQYIKPKQKATLRLTQEGLTKQITGIVESIEMPRFTKQITMQISLYCSQPFWEDVNFTSENISEIQDEHYFTEDPTDMLYFYDEGIVMGTYDFRRSSIIRNTGDIAVGMQINITALGRVVNPTIYNSAGEFIGINRTLQAGDQVIITTMKGNKTITLNGENIIADIKERSTWLQLDTGEDEFTIDSDDDTETYVYFTIIYRQRYV